MSFWYTIYHNLLKYLVSTPSINKPMGVWDIYETPMIYIDDNNSMYQW